MTYFKNYIAFFCLFILLNGCGYTPIFSSQNSQFNVAKYEISGDQDLGKIFVNNFIIPSKKEDVSQKIILLVNIKKNKTAASKDTAGKILSYNLEIDLKANVKNYETNKFMFGYSANEDLNFDTKDRIYDTNKLENKISQDLLQKITNNLILRINKYFAQQ